MADNKRSSQRFERRLPIEFEHGGEWQTAETRNISLGGAYVETSTRVPFGARVKVRLQIPVESTTIEVGASVRWSDESGFGVQFDGLRAREVWALGKYFEQGD